MGKLASALRADAQMGITEWTVRLLPNRGLPKLQFSAGLKTHTFRLDEDFWGVELLVPEEKA